MNSCLAIATLVAVTSAGCGGLELPEPPNLEPLDALYEDPTADIGPMSAEALLGELVTSRQRIEEIDDLRPVTSELIRLHDGIERDPDGGDEITLRGVPLPVDAELTLILDCPGAGDGAIEAAAELTLVIRQSALIPVVFGLVEGCELRRTVDESSLAVLFSGELSAYLPNVLERDAPRIILVAFELAQLSFAGRDVGPRGGNFRLVGDRLEVLLDGFDGGTAVGFRLADSRLGLRGRNGEWSCTSEERRCDRAGDPSDSFGF